MMFTQCESENYAWNYDGLYGVGSFERKSDGALTLLVTGSDCQELCESLERLAQNESGERFNMLFDSIASEYTFEGESGI